MPDQQSLAQIGQAMLNAAPDDWRRIMMEASGAANMVKIGLEVELTDGTVTRRIRPPRGAGKLCADVRESMYQEGNGTWYNATFVVDEAHQISADFDYEHAPFGGIADDDDPDNEGDADPELLLEDHRMFPRDVNLLPDWHPAHQQSEN